MGGFVLALPEEEKQGETCCLRRRRWGQRAHRTCRDPCGSCGSRGKLALRLPRRYAVLALGIGAFLNALPFESTAGPSDGKHILAALQGRDLGHSGAASRLLGLAFAGVRPRDWPTNLVEAVRTAPHEGLMAIQAHAILYGWHLDRGEIDQAKAALAKARHAMTRRAPRPWPPACSSKQAFVAAYIDGDGTAARALCRSTEKGFAEPYAVARAEAAAALALNEHEAAREALTRPARGPGRPDAVCDRRRVRNRRLAGNAAPRRSAAAPVESAP